MVVKGYGDIQIQALNTVSRKWTMADYIAFYANKGCEAFLHIQELKQAFPRFPDTSILRAYAGGSVHKYYTDARNGNLKPRDYNQTFRLLSELKAIGDHYPFYFQNNFLSAYVSIRINKPDFHPKEFLKKMASHSGNKPPFARTSQARDFIEYIYNYRRQNKINLRF